jgi:predicted  nucleic acid-binding Zn-ribbon protein
VTLEQANERAKMRAEIERLRTEVDRLARRDAAATERTRPHEEIVRLERRIADSTARAAGLRQSVAALQARVDEARVRESGLRHQLDQAARETELRVIAYQIAVRRRLEEAGVPVPVIDRAILGGGQ